MRPDADDEIRAVVRQVMARLTTTRTGDKTGAWRAWRAWRACVARDVRPAADGQRPWQCLTAVSGVNVRSPLLLLHPEVSATAVDPEA